MAYGTILSLSKNDGHQNGRETMRSRQALVQLVDHWDSTGTPWPWLVFLWFPRTRAASFTVSPSSKFDVSGKKQRVTFRTLFGNNLTILVNGAKLTRTSTFFESTDFPL